jgi:hypothetical protein
MTARRTSRILVCIVVFVVSLALSLSLITSNLHYFYHEDDAHHFNRTVEMAQRRDPNPHYFNKPALHFYLRIPVVYASVAYERVMGRMHSIKEIRTRDPYGLAGYSYTPSHPRVLAWNRLLSGMWSALLAVCTFLIACRLAQPTWSAAVAAGIVVISPEVLKNSYIIGVDTLMALGCVVTTAYALWTIQRVTPRTLMTCAFLAGLTCAAKYNAAPICIVPATVWWLYDRRLKHLFLIGGVALFGFLMGAPYSLLSFDEFWRGVTYEAWHYGVAGHEGHMAERGWPQALLYLRWLLADGIGVGGVVAAIVGASILSVRDRKKLYILLSFPVTYALLMIAQKAHFTRNMLVLVPYGAVLAGCGLAAIFQLCKRASTARLTSGVAILLCLLPLAKESYRMISSQRHITDSRDLVVQWLQTSRPRESDVAIAGPLQLPIHVFALPGVDAFNQEKQSLAELVQAGYEFIVAPTNMTHLDAELTEIVHSMAGEPWPQRVPNTPAISILHVKASGLLQAAARAPRILNFSLNGSHLQPQCTPQGEERYCWVTSKTTHLSIPRALGYGSLEIMSPWTPQVVSVSDSHGTLVASTKLKQPGVWESLPIPLRSGSETTGFILSVSQVKSPESQGTSSDRRRLGVAVKLTP